MSGRRPTSARARKSYDSSLVAYDAGDGRKVRWAAGNRPASYASPVVTTLAGERQILMVNESWVTAHRASDGKVLWEHPWGSESDTTASCVQPIPLAGDRVLLARAMGSACRCCKSRATATSKFAATPFGIPPINPVMKSKFANLVLRDGYAYGLDEVMVECVEVETREDHWKKRRHPEFGHGQVMLIGDTLLVLSETGELALVEATPTQYHELASIQALDPADITWNNPAFSAPYLLVRNAREAACYRLPLVGESLSEAGVTALRQTRFRL